MKKSARKRIQEYLGSEIIDIFGQTACLEKKDSSLGMRNESECLENIEIWMREK